MSRHTSWLDVGWSADHTALVTVHRDDRDYIIVDDVFHLVGTRESPVRYEAIEAHILRLHRRLGGKIDFVVDQWGARQLIQRLRTQRVSIVEVTVTASYHDRIARSLIELQKGHRLKLFPHEGLQKQLASVVLKRSLAASRDDSSVRVRIDSGAGVGVGSKDDLVVALAGASFEASTARHGPLIAFCCGPNDLEWVRRREGREPPTQALQLLRQQKVEQQARELEEAARVRAAKLEAGTLEYFYPT